MKQILRSIGVCAALFAGLNASAQLPNYGVFPSGITITDYPGGTTHDFDAILDSGQPIILDLFAVWCSPCWSYHQAGTLESVYNSIGAGGTNEVFIITVDADPSTAESTLMGGGNSIGDWVTGTDYPVANDDNIASAMNLAYYPTLLLICPDRSVTEVGQASQAQWEAAVAGCGSLSTSANDPRIISNESASYITLCGTSGTAATDIKVAVQNYSNTAINGSYDIEATVGGSTVASTTATLTLDPYEATEVNLGSAALALGTNNLVVTITTANDDTNNDAISFPIAVEQAADLGMGDIILSLSFDGYGSEVGYGLASGTVQETDAFTAYPAFNGGSYPGQIAFEAIGSWTDSDTDYSTSWTGLDAGCYHLYMFDNYGDGMTVGSNGSIEISSPNSSITESMSVDYESGGWFTFEITTDGTGGFAGLDKASQVNFAKVYPNPAVELTNVQFNLLEASHVTIEVVNAVGQIVYTNNLGEINGLQNIEISTSDLQSGMYLVNINVNGNILTERISIVK